MRLGLEEGRVIGCLIEKQLTTPQQYPLTLNALVTACNQSSNRHPVVSYDDHLVEQSLARLKDAGLVRFVHPSHGRSVIRFGQTFGDHLGLDERSLAVIAVLLLRGPQTLGELRARTERMARFEGTGAVEAELERLAARAEPLTARLHRRPGQKEERWIEVLTAGDSTADVPASAVLSTVAASSSGVTLGTGPPETVLPDPPPEWSEALRTARAAPAEERRAAVATVAGVYPRFVDAWAELAELAEDDVESYAYARVGYHRGLDALRAAGWRGSGYVRRRHPSNVGFLRALEALRRAAEAIGETEEVERCTLFLHQLDPDRTP